jgi:hypothetical protein
MPFDFEGWSSALRLLLGMLERELQMINSIGNDR